VWVLLELMFSRNVSVFRVERIRELGTMLAVTSRVINSLLITANIAPSSWILSALKMETTHSFKTMVLTRPTWCQIPEGGILQVSSYCHSNVRGYI
jgi:hypothetical protein